VRQVPPSDVVRVGRYKRLRDWSFGNGRAQFHGELALTACMTSSQEWFVVLSWMKNIYVATTTPVPIWFPRTTAAWISPIWVRLPKPVDAGKSILIMNVHPSASVNPPWSHLADPFAPDALGTNSKIDTDEMPSRYSRTAYAFSASGRAR